MNRLNAKAGATFCADKENDGAGFLLHKCKEGAIQWLYRYTFHGLFMGAVVKWVWVL